MRIAVIGAGGYIGRFLCAYLRAQGEVVVEYSSKRKGGIDPLTGVFSPDFAFERGVECVVHLAQSPWVTKAASKEAHVLGVNVVTAVQAASAAVAVGARRFVYASTGNVYQWSFGALAENAPLRLDNWYSLSKVHAEQALALFREQIDVHVLRLFGVYGPGQKDRLVKRLAQRVLQRDVIHLARHPVDENDQGGLRLSLCYVDDVNEIFHQFAREGGPGTVNVAGDDAVSIREIAMAVGGRRGIEPILQLADDVREGDLIADNELLKKHLNPRFTSFETGIKRLVESLT